MKFSNYLILLLLSGSLAFPSPLLAQTAPDFTLNDAKGNTHTLSDHQGKYVVLEWVNYDCPFIRKHYNSNKMQNLQKKYRAKDVIWFSICSSAPGKQGFFKGKTLLNRIEKEDASPTAYLVDPTGKVGKKYNAKTTPHMFVIDPKGTLIYQGAIDDYPGFNPAKVSKAKNHITTILDSALAGKKIPRIKSKAYGCSIKYGKSFL